MSGKILPILLLFFGFALYAMSFEPFCAAEGAYVFSAFLLWAAHSWKSSNRLWKVAAFAGAWASWIFILAWLRFVYPT